MPTTNSGRTLLTAAMLAIFIFAGSAGSFAQGVVDLGGTWRFAMDREDAGLKEQWQNKPLADSIKLPGILQSQGYGDEITATTDFTAALPRDMRWYLLPQYEPYTHPGNIKVPYLSQPPRHYLGVAWYQRDLDIPADWAGKNVHIYLERPRWETRLFIDATLVGSDNSLCAPHEYDLGALSPGKHVLSVRCDTRLNIVPGYRKDGHSVSDALGYSWNGIAGHILMSAHSPVWIADAQVYPNVEKKSAHVKITLGNITGKSGSGTITSGKVASPVRWDEKGGDAEMDVDLGPAAQTWDEFHPALQTLDFQLKGDSADDEHPVTFGLREIKADGLKMLLNGTEINLRMTHSGGDFPLTGYPATDVDSWKKIFQTCKDFGLNGMRFHSWCPPDEAFTAADQLGFYIAPECGMWNPFNPGDAMTKMLELETARIKKAYGNHPSFLLLSASNETSGRWPAVLNAWAANWYKDDPRRLYSTNTGRSNPRDPGAQYASTPYRQQRGWFGNDYRDQLQGAIMPVIGHEVGQWCAYPDFNIINKMTGYLEPKNYEIYRDSAVAHDVLKQNKEFTFNSGKFQVACYKEEIEGNLRTPGAAGFQLLDLHDYLGQGGALVGILDCFWESKGYETPQEFSRFCNSTVPLARLYSSVLRTSDKFEIATEIAHFGPAPLTAAKAYWKVIDLTDKAVASGEFAAKDIPIGKSPLGTVSVDLSKLAAPQQYKLVVGITGTKFENDWNFWLYPAQVDTDAPADVLLTSDWKEASDRLAAGGKVLFVPTLKLVDDLSPPLDSVPVFWNRLMNPKLSAMLGLVIDPKSPALAEFPTETWCDWEWSELVRNVRAINIEKAPKELTPIVQAIDDWSRNYKLGVIFESNVGSGKLLVCSIDINTDLDKRIGARQLRKSLLTYMAGNQFQPKVTMTAQQASLLWPGPGNAGPSTNPTSQSLPGDIIEAPSTPRPRQ